MNILNLTYMKYRMRILFLYINPGSALTGFNLNYELSTLSKYPNILIIVLCLSILHNNFTIWEYWDPVKILYIFSNLFPLYVWLQHLVLIWKVGIRTASCTVSRSCWYCHWLVRMLLYVERKFIWNVIILLESLLFYRNSIPMQ